MGLSEETGSARRRDADASEETGSAWRGRSSVFEPTAGKIKDKRDMMGKGTTEESLFGFEATGSSAAAAGSGSIRARILSAAVAAAARCGRGLSRSDSRPSVTT